MVACPEQEKAKAAPPGPPPTRRVRRTHPELLAELVFRPLAGLLVRVLAPLGVPPPAVVVANAVAGLGAAVLVALEQPVAAALALQLKTVLDNADGQLARVTGRASALGRYLDTEADLAVNVAVFVALASVLDAPVLVALAFLALTFVLSADFNEDALYRRARGQTVVTEPSPAGEGAAARVLARAYRLVFGLQDDAFQAFAGARLRSLLAGKDDETLRARAALAYHDDVTSAVLANLGLSSQLAVLGLCLVAGVPEAFLWLVVAEAALLLPLLQLRRELRVRRVLRPSPA